MAKIKDFNIYIGYDVREDMAAQICRYSIVKRITDKRRIKFLRSKDIPQFFGRPQDIQSTDFTYTRFFIPYIEQYEGFSVFVDCDFLFLDDINELVNSVNPDAAVSVVKHPSYNPRTSIKMDGIPQHGSHRKNWASLMVFNNQKCKQLTVDYINNVQPGRSLHEFKWVDDKDIGSISLDWNTLDGYYELDNPRAIHYTDGGPWFKDYKQTYYSKYWWNEYYEYTDSRGEPRTLSPDA